MTEEYNYIVDNENYSEEQKRESWDVAIGLQEVDDLKVSDDFKKLVEEEIQGKLTYEELESLLYEKYEKYDIPKEVQEAELVSKKISYILRNSAFVFSYSYLKTIHKIIFDEIYPFAGEFRKNNIAKAEPILARRSVSYADYFAIEDTFDYDFKDEKNKKYSQMSNEEKVKSIADFTSRIWQVHAFGEGNTRTTAVFIEKYLNYLGFKNINNEYFKEYAKYFRNALVRANFSDVMAGVDADFSFLEKFFENLLFKGEHILKNRDLIPEQYINEIKDDLGDGGPQH